MWFQLLLNLVFISSMVSCWPSGAWLEGISAWRGCCGLDLECSYLQTWLIWKTKPLTFTFIYFCLSLSLKLYTNSCVSIREQIPSETKEWQHLTGSRRTIVTWSKTVENDRMTGVKVSLIVPPSLCPWAAPSFRARCSRSFSRCTASPRASRSWWPRWRTTTVKTNQPGRKKTAAASKSLCRSVWGIFWGAMRRTELLWQHWKSFPGLVTSSRRAL